MIFVSDKLKQRRINNFTNGIEHFRYNFNNNFELMKIFRNLKKHIKYFCKFHRKYSI